MNGIERLLAFADTMPKGVEEELYRIADQIQRETLPRPRFEDGEPAQFGDPFVDPVSGYVEQVKSMRFYGDGDGEKWLVLGDGAAADGLHGPLKRPESLDSWERIEADVNKGSACRYFGVPDSEEECGKCAAQWDDYDLMSCAESMARDVLRRCKALAGVE